MSVFHTSAVDESGVVKKREQSTERPDDRNKYLAIKSVLAEGSTFFFSISAQGFETNELQLYVNTEDGVRDVQVVLRAECSVEKTLQDNLIISKRKFN